MSEPGLGKGGGAVAVATGAAVLPATGANWAIPVALVTIAALVVWGVIYLKHTAR